MLQATRSLTAFTQSLGSVSAKDGIRVVADRPGPVATEEAGGTHEKRRSIAPAVPTVGKTYSNRCRLAAGLTQKELALLSHFIASERSAYTSGSVVTIDAGLSARAQAFLKENSCHTSRQTMEIKLYYEETGKGIPIVFIHEFAGDLSLL